MFIQVMRGTVTDRAELRAMLDRWLAELAPHATGWLGTTCGVTADDTFIALVRFESEPAARANSDRPEQHQWWMETSKLFAGDVTFHDCRETSTFLRGGSDEAGFVQVMQGRSDNLERLRELDREMDQYAGFRPDLIGGVTALHGDGGFTQAAYFTSEAEARKGEKIEPPAAIKALMDEFQSLVQGMEYLDLPEPWLFSPR